MDTPIIEQYWAQRALPSLFHSAGALNFAHSKTALKELNRKMAAGAKATLNLHGNINPWIAMNEMGWLPAEGRVAEAQLMYHWRLLHRAPPKVQRVHAICKSTEAIHRHERYNRQYTTPPHRG